jgi:DNA-binding NarL/FixJ family response regulator
VERISVHVQADDPILQAGVAGQLRPRPEVRVVDADEAEQAGVVLVVTDRLTEGSLQILRSCRRAGVKLVLLVSAVDDGDFIAAVEAGISGLIRRSEATAERLVNVIRSAVAGEGAVPPDLLGRLLDQLGKLRRQELLPRGLTFNGFTEREIEVLRLVAEGLDTAEIATKLSYSQRTVKNVMHDITSRLHLHNRAHAVAYALRQGLL